MPVGKNYDRLLKQYYDTPDHDPRKETRRFEIDAIDWQAEQFAAKPPTRPRASEGLKSAGGEPLVNFYKEKIAGDANLVLAALTEYDAHLGGGRFGKDGGGDGLDGGRGGRRGFGGGGRF